MSFRRQETRGAADGRDSLRPSRNGQRGAAGLPPDALIRIREGDRVRAVEEIPARTFQQRCVLPGWTCEVAEYGVLHGLPCLRVKGDAPGRWISARAFARPGGES